MKQIIRSVIFKQCFKAEHHGSFICHCHIDVEKQSKILRKESFHGAQGDKMEMSLGPHGKARKEGTCKNIKINVKNTRFSKVSFYL